MRILLVQTAFFGDLILSTPVISGLRSCYPEAKIYVMTTAAAVALLKHDPLIDEIITFDKKGRHAGISGFIDMVKKIKSYNFDRVYALQRSYRTALLLWAARIPVRIGFSNAKLSFLYHIRKIRPKTFHDVMRNLAILEGEGEGFDDHIRLVAPPLTQVKEQIRDILNSSAPTINVFPGSEWKTKMWHWQEYRKLIEHYAMQGFRILVLGGAKEQPIADTVSKGIKNVFNLTGKTTLDEMLLLVKNSKLVICNDSMALHVAAGFKIPVVAVFCATSPSFGFGPWKTPNKIVERSDLACKPCRRHGSRSCPLGTEECMRGIPAAKVISAADELLGAV
jgi:heptosyltransferase II